MKAFIKSVFFFLSKRKQPVNPVENFENQQVSHENEIRELQNQILDSLNTSSSDIERVRLYSYQDLVEQVN